MKCSPWPLFVLFVHKAEDEEVFEEIRRLRLERARLLQKIKALEQQQQSALSALEEVAILALPHWSFYIHPCIYLMSTIVNTGVCACMYLMTMHLKRHFYMCAIAIPTKTASRGGRSREGQTAWGAEGGTRDWSQRFWRHGWNAWFPRYAGLIFVYFPVPSHRTSTHFSSCIADVPLWSSFVSYFRVYSDLFLFWSFLNILFRKAALQALQSLPCPGRGRISNGHWLSQPLRGPCRTWNSCWAA